MNDKGVYRIAPATLGLLNILLYGGHNGPTVITTKTIFQPPHMGGSGVRDTLDIWCYDKFTSKSHFSNP